MHKVKSKKTFDDYINSIIKFFKERWERDRLIYIDNYLLNKDEKLSNDVYPLEHIFKILLEDNFNILPVLHIDQSETQKFILKSLVNTINRGVALRIPLNYDNELNTILNESTKFLEIKKDKIDLILDMQDLSSVDIKHYGNFIIDTVNQLNGLNTLRSFVISGGTLPLDLQKIDADSVKTIPRNMWLIWKHSVGSQKLKRIPSYSDYCISHRLMSETSGGPPNPSASIRYTHENKFFIYRGRGLKQHKHAQYFAIAEALYYSNHYYDQKHCAGDEFIFECATEKKKPGSPEKWRWVGTAHHITVVVNQLRQFFRDLRD